MIFQLDRCCILFYMGISVWFRFVLNSLNEEILDKSLYCPSPAPFHLQQPAGQLKHDNKHLMGVYLV